MEFIGNKEIIEKDLLAKAVYDELQQIIDDDTASLYYKFPFYMGQIDEERIEARLLLISAQYGIFCFDLDNKGKFDTQDSNRVDSLYNEISSRMLKFPVLRESRSELKYKIATVLVGEYNSFENKGDYVLCPISYLATFFKNKKLENPIPEEDFSLINSCVDGTTNLQQKKSRKEHGEYTKASILNEIQTHISTFDIKQKKVASVEIDSPQRIRGLAGSGKTVILAYKAAFYHANHPDHQILYTFYTKSLGDSVRNLIGRAYRNFFNKEPNWEKITICHAWGSSSSDGVYYRTCINNEQPTMTFGEANFKAKGQNPFGYACKMLLKGHVTPEYDLILIDEGQDFPAEFYQMCYRLCKDNKRICWAYDDFQNIFDVKIQDEQETFGYNEDNEPHVHFQPKDELCDIVLEKCYRTPRYSLIYAFALGLGIYHDKVLQRLESNEQWKSLGFNVEMGNSKTGDEMVISRPPENSPSYSNELFDSNSIQCKQFADLRHECNYISGLITKAINKEGLLPTDICVICIDTRNVKNYFNSISLLLNEKEIDTFNLLNAPYSNTSFFRDGYVTLSTVNKAKGNECGMVIICGVDAAFDEPDNVVVRDRLFTSMTRTKGWLYMTGCGDSMKLLKKELHSLEKNEYKLVFTQPDEKNTKNIENVSKAKVEAQKNILNQIQKLKQATGMSDDEIKDLLNALLNNK